MSKPKKPPAQTIAFQGAPGAYSEMACRGAYPQMTPLACRTFADTFQSKQKNASGWTRDSGRTTCD